MKIKHLVLAIIMSFLATGCYGKIIGTVVDAETGKPIEGAVVSVKWTETKGFGLTHTELYKAAETVTDRDGKFRLEGVGVFNISVNPPRVVVYKKGYVAWMNDFIFPNYEKRTDFKWQGNYVLKLKRFKRKYSHSRHISFFITGFTSDLFPKLDQAYSWEDSLASKEEDLLRKKRKIKKPGEYTEKEMWREIVEELYFQKGDDVNEQYDN